MSSRVNQLSSSPPMGVIISIVPLYCHKKKYLLSLWHHCFQQSDTDCCDQYITSQHVVRWREINESRAPELKLLALKVNDQWSHPCVWFHFRSPNSLRDCVAKSIYSVSLLRLETESLMSTSQCWCHSASMPTPSIPITGEDIGATVDLEV